MREGGGRRGGGGREVRKEGGREGVDREDTCKSQFIT